MSATLDPLQYLHLEKLYGHLPGLADALPAVFGLSPAAYDAARRGYADQARQAARELLAEEETAQRVAALPFGPGSSVLAVGDSVTDDLRSWAEVLRHLLDLVRPEDPVTVVNGGLSAHTTAMVLRRWPATLAAANPDWVVCALGGNDVTRVGPAATKTQVSTEESLANLRELRRLAREAGDPGWVWLTPIPVDPVRAAAFPGFRFGQSSWDNADVVALAEGVRQLGDPVGDPGGDPVVDLVEAFGVPAREHLQGPDGVHPALAGQQEVVRALLRTLAP